MAKAVLFDMDGVLVDSETLMCKSTVKALAEQGIKITEEEYYSHWTRNGKDVADFIRENNLLLDREKYRREKKTVYYDLAGRTPRIAIEGAQEKVKEFSKIYKLALVSSSGRDYINRMMQATGLKDYFQVLIGAEDVEKEKPAPDGFLMAAQLLSIKPNECVVIEDAEKGILAAKNAGMKVIAIPTAHTSNNNFSKADYVASKISDITKDLIDSL